MDWVDWALVQEESYKEARSRALVAKGVLYAFNKQYGLRLWDGPKTIKFVATSGTLTVLLKAMFWSVQNELFRIQEADTQLCLKVASVSANFFEAIDKAQSIHHSSFVLMKTEIILVFMEACHAHHKLYLEWLGDKHADNED